MLARSRKAEENNPEPKDAWAAMEAFKKAHRKYVVANLTPLLPYWHIEGNLVVLQDGSYEVGFFLEPGPDIYRGYSEREAISARIAGALDTLPEGARVRFYLTSQEASLEPLRAYFQNKTNEDPLFRRFALEKTKYHLKEALKGRRLTWKAYVGVHVPTSATLSGRTFLTAFLNRVRQALGLGIKREPFSPLTEEEWAKLKEEARGLTEAFVAAMGTTGFYIRPLSPEEIFTAMYAWYNPAPRRLMKPRPLEEFWLPGEPKRYRVDPPTLRRQVAQSEIWTLAMDYLYKKQGEEMEFVAGYEMDLPPNATYWGIIEHLLAAAPMTILVEMVRLQKNNVLEYFSKILTRANRNLSGGGPPEASDITREGAALKMLVELESGETPWLVGLQAFLRSNNLDTLELLVDQYRSNLERFGGRVRHLREGVFYPYHQAAPFSGRRMKRTFYALGTNVAHLLSFATPWNREGESSGGSGGERSRPVVLTSNRYLGFSYLDPFEPQARAWNAIIVGSTGSGKTFSTLSLLTEMYASTPGGLDIIIVDKKGDYQDFVEMMGGSVIRIAPGEDAINIFAPPPDPETGKPPPDIPDAHLAFLQRVYRILFRREGDPNAALKEQLWLEGARVAYQARVERVYDTAGREVGYEVTPPLLQEVVNTIRTLDQLGGSALSSEQKVVARELATELSGWATGPVGYLFSKQTTVNERNPILYYELSGLDQFRDERLMAMVLALLSYRIYTILERRPKERRKLLIFDEAHALFKVKEAAELVVDLYRRARSYNAAAWTITQTLAEYRGAHVQGLIENTNIFMFLNSKGQGEDIVEILAKPSGMPEIVGRIAETLRQEKGVFSEMMYILFTRDGQVKGDIFRLYPSPFEYWLFTSHAAEVAERKKRIKAYRGDVARAVSELAGVDPEEDQLVYGMLR